MHTLNQQRYVLFDFYPVLISNPVEGRKRIAGFFNRIWYEMPSTQCEE
jgi:hypothetical protein